MKFIYKHECPICNTVLNPNTDVKYWFTDIVGVCPSCGCHINFSETEKIAKELEEENKRKRGYPDKGEITELKEKGLIE